VSGLVRTLGTSSRWIGMYGLGIEATDRRIDTSRDSEMKKAMTP
jgi:hypothetical protein